MSWPPAWGPLYWKALHSIALRYCDVCNLTEVDSATIGRFCHQYCSVLPCIGCRLHALQFIRANPPKFKTGLEFWVYTVKFHNSVNTRLNRRVVSEAEARQIASSANDKDLCILIMLMNTADVCRNQRTCVDFAVLTFKVHKGFLYANAQKVTSRDMYDAWLVEVFESSFSDRSITLAQLRTKWKVAIPPISEYHKLKKVMEENPASPPRKRKDKIVSKDTLSHSTMYAIVTLVCVCAFLVMYRNTRRKHPRNL